MRRISTNLAGVISLAFGVYGLSSVPALAYLDAGTGSMILQVLLGGFAGLAMVGKLYWHRILVTLRIRSDAPTETQDASANATDARTGER